MTGFVKFLGVSVIVAAGILTGMYFKSQLKKRSNLLDQLLSSLVSLQNEISYGLCTLEESFLSISLICPDMVSGFYKSCAASLSQVRVSQFNNIWKQNAEQLFANLLFCGKEKEIFISLGNMLGTGDLESQNRSIELVKGQLCAIKERTDKELAGKTKLAGGLSLIIAAIIVLITI